MYDDVISNDRSPHIRSNPRHCHPCASAVYLSILASSDTAANQNDNVMASLELPSKEKLREIEARQDAKEKEILEKHQRTASPSQDTAARLIQVTEYSSATILKGSDQIRGITEDIAGAES